MQVARRPTTPLTRTTIRPPRRRLRLGIGDLWAYRELLYFFAWRDLKVRYKQSLFGAAWAILQPFAMMIVFTIFFGRLAKIPSNGIPFPIFYYSALVPWTYFQQAVTQSTNSLIGNSALVSKVYFPRMLLPLSSVVSSLVDFAIAFIVLIGMTGFYIATGHENVRLGLPLLVIPVLVLLTLMTALATGLWLSALNARYRDIRYAVGFMLQFWMFASPIAYPTSLVPEQWRALYGVNPITGVVEGFRWALTGQGHAPGTLVALSAGVVALMLFLAARYFKRYEGTVADVI